MFTTSRQNRGEQASGKGQIRVMDTLRSTFETDNPADETRAWDSPEDQGPDDQESDSYDDTQSVRELPPESIGQDERRMQVRAYNHWASLLGDLSFPSIEDLEPANLPDFGSNSVLLDFSKGIDDPAVHYLGDKLGKECGANGPIHQLSDVPARSLLSRITDHYMQILANQAPIGFEAEFVNQRGSAILYRGILLPFSSDDETIDFIYGVINWKEMADSAMADELLLEIDQALDPDNTEDIEDEAEPRRHSVAPVTEWADSPAHEAGDVFGRQSTDDELVDPLGDPVSGTIASLGSRLTNPLNDGPRDDGLPLPDFGNYHLDEPEVDEFGDEIEEDEGSSSYSFASLADYIETPAKKAIDLEADNFDPEDYRVEDASGKAPVTPSFAPSFGASFNEEPEEPDGHYEGADEAMEQSTGAPYSDPDHGTDLGPVPGDGFAEDAGLYDCLASARELAQSARATEDRSRQTLYAAVGRAYDFALAAKEEPREYDELIAENGLTVQERAPMTPVVKLVFGSDYDKTRLTEYAAVLSHAHRLELKRGTLAHYLGETEGGLKGVVTAERRLRRTESGKAAEPEDAVRTALAKKLRELETLTFEALSGEGAEFSLVMVRRDGAGNVAMLGEIDDDVGLIERAARKLVG
jgi:hypothetical protein